MAKRPKCIRPAEGQLLVDYEQGWMSLKEAEVFEQDHLARCAACRADLAYFRPVWATLRAHPEILERAEARAPDRSRKRRPRIVRWTLGVGLGVAVAAWLFRLL